MKRLNIIGALLILCIIVACSSKEPAVSSYTFYTYDTECLGINHDGSQVLLAWGTGKSNKEAAEAAVTEAVSTVMFKGIHKGNYNIKPLINKVNAENRYQNYLNNLMNDKYIYNNIIKGVEKHRAVKAHDGFYKVGQIVHINITGLQQQLINDSIISAKN